MRVSRAIDLYLASVCAGKQNETPQAYRTKLNKLVAVLDDVELETITAADLEQFRQYLLTQPVKRRGAAWVNAPLSVWYVRGVLRVVKQFFKWCADNDHVHVDIAHNLKVPKKTQVLPKAIDQVTFDKLLAAAVASGDVWARARDVALLCLLRDTGGRVGGLLAACVGDVDLKGGTLLVTEKGKTRAVFFCEASKAALGLWLALRYTLNVSSDALFIGRSGRGLRRPGVYRLLERLAVVAGVEGMRHNPHSFRHAFARDSLRAGADLSQVSQMMGHASVAVTSDYYARWLPSELQAVHKLTSPGASIKLPEGGKDETNWT